MSKSCIDIVLIQGSRPSGSGFMFEDALKEQTNLQKNSEEPRKRKKIVIVSLVNQDPLVSQSGPLLWCVSSKSRTLLMYCH